LQTFVVRLAYEYLDALSPFVWIMLVISTRWYGSVHLLDAAEAEDQ
jgi:hypothetical protein